MQATSVPLCFFAKSGVAGRLKGGSPSGTRSISRGADGGVKAIPALARITALHENRVRLLQQWLLHSKREPARTSAVAG